jgi:hypothetical protein
MNRPPPTQELAPLALARSCRMSGSIGDKIHNFAFDNISGDADDTLPRQLAEGEGFIQSVAVPAFEEVRQALARDGNQVDVVDNRSNAILRVARDGQEVFTYNIRTQITDSGSFPIFQARGINGRLNSENEGHLRPDSSEHQGYNVTHITKDELVQHVLNAYQVETEQAR